MRIRRAFPLLLLGLGLLAAGSSALLPDVQHRATAQIDIAADAPYALIRPSIFAHGATTLDLDGAGAFVGRARESDARAWIGADRYTEIAPGESGPEATTATTSTPTPTPTPLSDSGPAPVAAPTDPHGADLWTVESDASTGRVRLDPAPGEAVVLATDGNSPAPARIRLSWFEPARSPWLPVLLGVGAATALVGVVLLGRRRMLRAAAAAALIGVVLLSAVSAPVPARASPAEPDPTPGASACVTPAQLQRIVDAVVGAVAEADAAGPAGRTQAATRLSGPVLAARSAAYIVGSAYPGATTVAPLPASDVAWALPEATQAWPRRVSAVLGSASGTRAVSLVQASPRENYRVEYLAEVPPSTTFPLTASAAAAPDPAALLIAPTDIAAAYEATLSDRDPAPQAALFDSDDPLAALIGPSYRERSRQTVEPRGVITFGTAANAAEPVALATEDGGALVWAAFDETERVAPAPDAIGVSINVPAITAALSGAPSTRTGVEVSYTAQVLFAVPPTGSADRVRVLAFAQSAASAHLLRGG
ncbi:hypothetical protein HQQ81_01520 [Microbacteriaceae bacterium VKM Ac-2854]|nr:hypothetical protein [Microbacteriaceae bacterium VKM Ac-2854]